MSGIENEEQKGLCCCLVIILVMVLWFLVLSGHYAVYGDHYDSYSWSAQIEEK